MNTTTHRASCINYTLTVIAENNDATRFSDERDGTRTELTPETAEMATEWIETGTSDCRCGEQSANWHALWSHP